MPAKSDYRDTVGIVLGELRIEDMPWEPMFLVGQKKESGMKKSKIIRLMAEILAGLQVPASMGVLGAAHEPWGKLLTLIDTFGWKTVDEIQQELIRALEEEYFDELGEGFNGNE